MQRLPLTLSFGRCPLFELGKATTLLLDHLLTCREEGTDQYIHSDFLSVENGTRVEV